MSKNKKIRNATQAKTHGITFKSRVEKMVYTTLIENGITPDYERYTITLWDGFTPITPFYDQESDTQQERRTEAAGSERRLPKILVLKTSPVVAIRYTPDFHFVINNVDIWIEVKGIENDVFYIKKKMFRKYLDNVFASTGKRAMFFEIYTKRQLLQALQIINEYVKSITGNQSSDSSTSEG